MSGEGCIVSWELGAGLFAALCDFLSTLAVKGGMVEIAIPRVTKATFASTCFQPSSSFNTLFHLMEEQISCKDTACDAGGVCDQATRYGVARVADLYAAEIQCDEIERCFSASAEDRRDLSDERIDAMCSGDLDHH